MSYINEHQQQRDRNGLRDVCAADGRPGTPSDPLGTATDGFHIHRSHFADPSDGYHGQGQDD